MENNKNLNILIHELGNTLFSISGLLFNGNFKKAKEKICKIFGDLNIDKISNFNPIELLIKSKINKMIECNIEFSISKLEFPEIDDSYLCIIFGNIVDNAINFSLGAEKKFISVNFNKTNKFYIYSVSNYFSYGKYNSSKKESKLGIKNVTKILKKIGGKIRFKIKDNQFSTKIFLPSEIC